MINKKICVLIIIITIIFFIIGYTYNVGQKKKMETFFIKEPCDDFLSDEEYLIHMIPHHQVAVDVTLLHIKNSKNIYLSEVMRKLLWIQKYEISLMSDILKKKMMNVSAKDKMESKYLSIVSDFVKPNKLDMTNVYCDPHFFKPRIHLKKMKKMKLTDKMYITHMIPHHQVAVDMSKKLLKHTKNDFMIYLCYRIIKSQQEEVVLLSDLLKNNLNYKSKLII